MSTKRRAIRHSDCRMSEAELAQYLTAKKAKISELIIDGSNAAMDEVCMLFAHLPSMWAITVLIDAITDPDQIIGVDELEPLLVACKSVNSRLLKM